MSTLSPGRQIERYEVVRLLGTGGMAEVWLVRHTKLQTEHALKLLTLTGPGLGQRMVIEGRIQAKLDHPNVIRVADVLEVDGSTALVMELVDGPDLARWIREEKPSPKVAERVFRGIVAGVEAAHAAGVIHRDLKPSNVLLATLPTGEIVPKVGDFGLVKVVQPGERGQTRTGIPLGTPQYMAPEQIRDAARVDVRADIFSLGCILYELLSWEQAYPGTDLIDIFERIDSGRRPPLPDRVPRRLRLVVDRCLERDPADRPQSCAMLLELLDSRAAPSLAEVSPAADVAAAHSVLSRSSAAQASASSKADKESPSQPGSLTARSLSPMVLISLLGSVLTVLLLTLVVVLVAIARLQGEEVPLTRAVPVCQVEPRLLGVVRAPGIFEKRVGSTWIVRENSLVRDQPDGQAVCELPAGARLKVVEEPIRRGLDSWVAVDGESLVFGAPEAPDPSPHELVAEVCSPSDGAPFGWVHIAIRLGQTPPRKGSPFKLTRNTAVRTQQSGGEVLCALPEGTELQVREMRGGRPPIALQYWVQVDGDSFRLP